MRLIHLLQFCALAVTADAQCYLMDANAKCAVCWTTTYFAPDDKIGVRLLPCKSDTKRPMHTSQAAN
jgi:hypothetical protein